MFEVREIEQENGGADEKIWRCSLYWEVQGVEKALFYMI